MNLKKRKGGRVDEDDCDGGCKITQQEIVRSHFSLEEGQRLRKKCREEVVTQTGCECSIRVVGVRTVPPSVGLSSAKTSRGLKRKIGCIDAATQAGRKNKLEDDYVLSATIGKGKFGSVWLCKHKVTGAEFACKTLNKGEETVHREVEIMQHLSGHPGIVLLNAVYEDSEHFHLVMELCTGGRLIDQMAKDGPFSEHRAACLIKELLLVIKYCHDMGVVHRDIKPENILLTGSGKMKLADFGLAMRVATGQTLTGLAGSPAYVAPEVLSGSYREEADIWSAGVLLYAVLSGVLPFQGKSLENIFESIKTVSLDFNSKMWEPISKPARNLLTRMLTRNVSERITVDEVLGHPWILFYTEHELKSFPFKSKLKSGHDDAHYHQISSTSLPKPTRYRVEEARSGHVTESLSSVSSTKRRVASGDHPLPKSEDVEESSMVDVLTAAISQVQISEAKRSRLCASMTSPSSFSPQQPQYSANSLCAAF